MPIDVQAILGAESGFLLSHECKGVTKDELIHPVLISSTRSSVTRIVPCRYCGISERSTTMGVSGAPVTCPFSRWTKG